VFTLTIHENNKCQYRHSNQYWWCLVAFTHDYTQTLVLRVVPVCPCIHVKQSSSILTVVFVTLTFSPVSWRSSLLENTDPGPRHWLVRPLISSLPSSSWGPSVETDTGTSLKTLALIQVGYSVIMYISFGLTLKLYNDHL